MKGTARFTGALLVILMLGGSFSLTACRGKGLKKGDQERIEAIFKSGLEMGDDPFVRAETVRVLSLVGDPRLAEWVEPLSRGDTPMVRIAALRKLLQSEHPLGGRRALMIFSRGNEAEEYQVLEAVLASDDEEIKESILERAQRSASPRVRLRGLEAGLLAKIETARESGDPRLEQELLPELGRLVDDESPEVAARALRELMAAGQEQRVEQIIEIYLDSDASPERRRWAGRILMLVRAPAAREAFLEILDRDGEYDGEVLGIPEQRIDSELVRYAILGMSALGDPEFARPTHDYRTGADLEVTLEVLTALAPNPSSDAAITLGTAMRDAHPEIRRHAIRMYGQRTDAQASRLRGAIDRDDFEAQRMIVAILVNRFAEEWMAFLRARLKSDDAESVEQTLEQLRTLVRSDEEVEVLAELVPELEALARPEATTSDEVKNLAGYVLMRVSGESHHQLNASISDPETRYAYLEHLVQTNPAEHAEIFREHLYDDYFALRLMAAAGLARGFQDQLNWTTSDQATASNADE